MKGIILAAGKGSRLAELKLEHKSFAMVHKKHVIDYSLDLLTGGAPFIDEIIIVVGYHADSVINYVGNEYNGIPIRYVFQQELKGIAHAVLTAREELNDDFIMCLADEILLNPRLPEMVSFFKSTSAAVVCGCVIDENDFPMKPIAYELSEGNAITQVMEKPHHYPNSYRGIGECIFKKECLMLLDSLQPNPRRGELEMGDWIQMAIDCGKTVKAFDLADAYVNVNYAQDIVAANNMIAKKKEV